MVMNCGGDDAPALRPETYTFLLVSVEGSAEALTGHATDADGEPLHAATSAHGAAPKTKNSNLIQ